MFDIQTVNRMDRDRFVEAFGGVFEHSPWIAERAWAARPFNSPEALHAAMMDVVRAAAPEEKRRLLNAHPELAGKEARERAMTQDSTVEQGSAGLDRLSQRTSRASTASTPPTGRNSGSPSSSRFAVGQVGDRGRFRAAARE